jgi:hypothetical protein
VRHIQARYQIAVKARSWHSHSIIPASEPTHRATESDKAAGVIRFSQDPDLQAVLPTFACLCCCAFRSAHFRISYRIGHCQSCCFCIHFLGLRRSSEIKEVVSTSCNGIRQSERSYLARLIFCFSKGAGEGVGDGKQFGLSFDYEPIILGRRWLWRTPNSGFVS